MFATTRASTELATPALSASAIHLASSHDVAAVFDDLHSSESGLSSSEAQRRQKEFGPNVLRSRRARPGRVLLRQVKSPILVLLAATAGVSMLMGESVNALIIGIILLVSVGLGFVNEFRAERAADALHDQVTHTAAVLRDGELIDVDVRDLVPGDVVHLGIGSVIPADMRLFSAHNLSCDEGILTGESMPVEKAPDAVAPNTALGDLASCMLMGTVVQSGVAVAVVVATGVRTEFGMIAAALGQQEPQTAFQRGLSSFSVLLLKIAVILTSAIFVANILLQRSIIDSLLFSLAIAVGITPQLLPAVVSASLAAGSRALAKKNVLVKRLVCIEDLGDMDLLITDKTGTLTEGRITFASSIAADGRPSASSVLLLGLLATEGSYSSVEPRAGLNSLDSALWLAPGVADLHPEGYIQLDLLPFDHERRMTTVLVDDPNRSRMIVTKGSAEDVFRRCLSVSPEAEQILESAYRAGSRVVAVAHRAAEGMTALAPADETGFTLDGFVILLDPPKSDARASLERLAELGIDVKIATGDSAMVAEKVVGDLGLAWAGTLTGADIDDLDDPALGTAAAGATIFARVSPEQKARVIRVLRHSGRSVAFLGDGVNDALALHQADVGISVETAADVAKDAADVLLLDKDLGVLATGVVEGRRIFANTIKYVLMGSSSNFGNMFSASAASLVLNFLPMMPGQILLNNLLYDSGQLAIPGDRVDAEQLRAPSHWNIAYIRRFMLLFGPISSLFDFATFALMIFVFQASQSEFQSGWFIESIATQVLIIFAIRTRRVPFFRSGPSLGLVLASVAVVVIGVALPFSPLSAVLGFSALPAPFFLALIAMVVVYLVLVEAAKSWFFSRPAQQLVQTRPPARGRRHRIDRRAARFTARREPR